VCPELNLEIRYELDTLLHFSKESLKFNYISELRIDLSMVYMIVLYMLLNYILIPEYSELMLQRWFLLQGYIKL